ncbi:peptidylprolyl isomerase [Synechococcus sp. CS-1332]|uniref:peptidylprolyl isomerase n=1 Tax=Synechococcus sp. CS-1332 TaxID=2847972 RepID=UPI00223AB775|nr:peptidylprolyl isomerase [Synechococcus sp. CS-1332]MCT0207174.1 peptidylprolyl isomerase [Synechococcus sp. CS-1332]
MRFRTNPAALGWRLLLLALLGLTPLGLAACAADTGNRPLGCEAASTPCLQGTAVVAMDTSKGPVELRLDGAAAPLTAGNFVDLVRRGVYNGTVFHRVVREPVPFVVQGGDPSSADPKVPASDYGSGGFVDPASGESRRLPLELKLNGSQEPRYGEEITTPTATRQLALSHERGAIAMARSSDPNSASSQFYVALQALPELDGRYAVFGRVTKGMDVIDRIQQGDKLIKARVIEGGTLVQKKKP